MNEKTVSIIIPIYNAEKHLERCLDSVKAQTYDCFEVLMIDDGSVDDSASICASFVKNDSRFRYIYQDNRGPDMARKTGIDEASGEYAVFADSDDYVSSDMLEKMVSAMEASGADLVCSQIVRFDERREWPGLKGVDNTVILDDRKAILKSYFEDGVIIGTYYAKMVKTGIMKNYGFIRDGLIGEDITASLFMLKNSSKVAIIPDRTYYYYQNLDSISHSEYSPRHLVSLNNYIRVRDELLEEDIIPEPRICGYFAGFQMAVATAMSRKGEYIKEAGEILRADLKKHLKNIKADKKTGLYMKICISLYVMSPRFFFSLYRIFYLITGR